MNTRDERQKTVGEWCAAAFGVAHASSVPQRALRLLEEAIEAFQVGADQVPRVGCCTPQLCATCGPDCGGRQAAAGVAHKLVDYVFSRPVGELGQELGGIGVTLLALANAAGLSADAEEAKETARVLSKPLEHFAARNLAKNEAGFNVTAPEMQAIWDGKGTEEEKVQASVDLLREKFGKNP